MFTSFPGPPVCPRFTCREHIVVMVVSIPAALPRTTHPALLLPLALPPTRPPMSLITSQKRTRASHKAGGRVKDQHLRRAVPPPNQITSISVSKMTRSLTTPPPGSFSSNSSRRVNSDRSPRHRGRPLPSTPTMACPCSRIASFPPSHQYTTAWAHSSDFSPSLNINTRPSTWATVSLFPATICPSTAIPALGPR